ncbi:hypothetical protein BTVI_26116 [Pitangus sulphuratus]|nr:hypothetical protein BTVI_26116 [Pitangus sulphuratus]
MLYYHSFSHNYGEGIRKSWAHFVSIGNCTARHAFEELDWDIWAAKWWFQILKLRAAMCLLTDKGNNAQGTDLVQNG